ncbi:hypothetical protein OG613_49090 (plasmid) [Streptomyces sp. NBC_00015]|uniref:hypothetical protein n=1 Tax=Streptomyces sp. NBC_00015 TaxID=2903611 RepID=UPI003251CF5F
MTTASRRPTVTVRIDTADHTPDPAAYTYTATVYLNTHDDSFDGYQPHHPLAAATHPDGSPLRLVFHASARITDHEAVADAAFCVGNHWRADDAGQTWPADSIRCVSTGDVIKVTGPDHWILHLQVDSYGYPPVPEPTTLVNLATRRR